MPSQGSLSRGSPGSAEPLPSEQLGLQPGIHAGKLRWFTAEGQLISLPKEGERQAKEQIQQQLEQLKAIMRSQGLDPNRL